MMENDTGLNPSLASRRLINFLSTQPKWVPFPKQRRIQSKTAKGEGWALPFKFCAQDTSTALTAYGH